MKASVCDTLGTGISGGADPYADQMMELDMGNHLFPVDNRGLAAPWAHSGGSYRTPGKGSIGTVEILVR